MFSCNNIYLHLFCAFLISFVLGIVLIKCLKKFLFNKKIYQPISGYIKHHKDMKKQTHTMGGIAIVSTLITCIVLFCDKNNNSVHILICTLICFFYIGLKDDISKIKKSTNIGYSAKNKMLFIFLVSVLLYILHVKYKTSSINTSFVSFPQIKRVFFLPQYVYFLFFTFVVCGSSNAVNITDGLDGLAITIILICSLVLCCICYFMIYGNNDYYLHFRCASDVRQMMVVCAILFGTCLAFLWYNAYPASIFMGDCGSLSLGASLSMISIIIKQEFLYAIVGIFFIMSALSVIIQVTYFRFSGGKRVFKIAPLHHHFEKIGMSESKIVSRVFIFTSIFGIISITLLI